MANQAVHNVASISHHERLSTNLGELTTEQLDEYARTGLILLDNVFSLDEIERIRTSADSAMTERTERTVFETGSETVRSVYGVHQHSRIFSDLARHPRLVAPTRSILKRDVYVYQSKINTKAVFGGDVWPWHQDYVFWMKEDSMPTSRAITVSVFLDDVTEVNGPISFIPGSHRHGILETDTYEGLPSGYEKSPDWIANVVAKLKYTIAKRAFLQLAKDNGIVTPKGRAGSVLLFDSNVAHASSLNLSPYERRMALFTYNAVDNAPAASGLHRPEFLVSRDVRPVEPVANDVFVR